MPAELACWPRLSLSLFLYWTHRPNSWMYLPRVSKKTTVIPHFIADITSSCSDELLHYVYHSMARWRIGTAHSACSILAHAITLWQWIPFSCCPATIPLYTTSPLSSFDTVCHRYQVCSARWNCMFCKGAKFGSTLSTSRTLFFFKLDASVYL